MKVILGGTGALLLAGVLALIFLFLGEDEPRSIDTDPQAGSEEQAVAPAQLADPGTIPEEEPQEELTEGYVVDPDGFVWEPLSYDNPQIKNNGDGTVTMKKLARIFEADGSMREVPITARATPDQRRLPIQPRKIPARFAADGEDGEDGEDEEDEEDEEDG